MCFRKIHCGCQLPPGLHLASGSWPSEVRRSMAQRPKSHWTGSVARCLVSMDWWENLPETRDSPIEHGAFMGFPGKFALNQSIESIDWYWLFLVSSNSGGSPADHQLITDDRRWPSHVLDVPMSLKVSLLRRATATCLMTTTRCFELKLLSFHCRNPHINGRSAEMWVTQRSSERRHST